MNRPLGQFSSYVLKSVCPSGMETSWPKGEPEDLKPTFSYMYKYIIPFTPCVAQSKPLFILSMVKGRGGYWTLFRFELPACYHQNLGIYLEVFFRNFSAKKSLF